MIPFDTLAVGLFHPWGDFNGRRHACRVDARAGRGSTLGNPPSFHAAPIKLSVASAAPELPSHRLLMACEKIFSASVARESTNACARSRSCSSKSRTLSSRALSSSLISGLGFIERRKSVQPCGDGQPWPITAPASASTHAQASAPPRSAPGSLLFLTLS